MFRYFAEVLVNLLLIIVDKLGEKKSTKEQKMKGMGVSSTYEQPHMGREKCGIDIKFAGVFFSEDRVLKEIQEPAKKGRNLTFIYFGVESCCFTVFPAFNVQGSAEKKAAKEKKAKGILE